jgi:hypothetical protein
MDTRLTLAILAMAATSCYAVAAEAVTDTDKPILALTLTAPRSVKSGSPLSVEIALTNLCAGTVLVGGGRRPPEFLYTFEVLDSVGKPAPLTEGGREFVLGERTVVGPDGQPRSEKIRVWVGSGWEQRLEPGKAFKTQLSVTGLFDLRRPGTYTIQVRPRMLSVLPPNAPLWKMSDDPSLQSLKSNVVTVTVIP